MESGFDGGNGDSVVNLEKMESHEIKDLDAEAPGSGSANSRKTGGSRDNGHSILNSVNKNVSQFKKPPHRRSASPLNWFPRKKTDSFLKRKIRLLQEVGGMSSTLDETLGDANPHYSRMAREKLAAREAAKKAMEARKAALVEASWCRILQAARIQSKEAEFELEKAEKCAVDAFEAATAMGVLIYDRPGCPWRPSEIEISSATGGRSTHKITASFETAFEVDKEVAAAVKNAFIKLASCPSSPEKEEFRDLLHKISQNPETIEISQEFSQTSSECDSDPELELEGEMVNARLTDANMVSKQEKRVKRTKCKNWQPATDCDNAGSNSFEGLVNIMLERLKGLQEDQLSSLAIIVATCGLNAALLEVDNCKDENAESVTNSALGAAVPPPSSMSSLGTGRRRYSRLARSTDGHMKRKEAAAEVPSLDKFLVKHVSRLEREVQEARNLRKTNSTLRSHGPSASSEMQSSEWEPIHSGCSGTLSKSTSDLGSILVKHVSRLERDIKAAKASEKEKLVSANGKSMESVATPSAGIQDKGGMLIQAHLSDLEKESEHEILSSILHEKERMEVTNSEGLIKEDVELHKALPLFPLSKEQVDKENVDSNTIMQSASISDKMHELGLEKVKHISRIERAKLEALKSFSSHNGDGMNETCEKAGLDKILVKPVHRLEREKMQALEQGNDCGLKRQNRKQGNDNTTNSEGLDKILVKHLSRLEKERLEVGTNESVILAKRRDQQVGKCTGSLDEILVKHQSNLEKAKLAGKEQPKDHIKLVDSRKEAKERELQEAWGGLSLGNSLRPHLSRLERDKAAWRRAEEAERRRAMEL